VLPENYEQFVSNLLEFIPKDRVETDPLKTILLAQDASFYLYVPKVVITAKNEDEVRRIILLARANKTPITFRSGGTSLSGQGQTDSVLVRLAEGWTDYKIFDEGNRIRLEPGLKGAQVNKLLIPYERKIGPDPASIQICKIGGIVNNNSSGMCCGTQQNAYHTMDSIRIVLADGTVLDTSNDRSIESFRQTHGKLLENLLKLKQKVLENGDLVNLIKVKYKIKNTMGYSINAFLDFEDPLDILTHLIVGSEGTLAFVSQVVYNTVPEYPNKGSSLVIFKDVFLAAQAADILAKNQLASAVELMDNLSLKAVVKTSSNIPEIIKEVPDGVAALLIETRAPTKSDLDSYMLSITKALGAAKSINDVEFTTDLDLCNSLWNIRRAIIPAVAKQKIQGSATVIEDIAFPIENLADATLGIQKLLEKYDYPEGVVFGHALAGNLHFIINQNFQKNESVEHFRVFLDDIANLVVKKFEGTLKGEHSTGRNMAPYLEFEWGKTAVDIMRDVKKVFDPEGIFNPGNMINDDPYIHVKNIRRPLEVQHPVIDRCVEVNFADAVCRNPDFIPSELLLDKDV